MKVCKSIRIACALLAMALLPLMTISGMIVAVWAAGTDEIYLSDIEWKSWTMIQSSSDNPNSPYKPSRNTNEMGGPLSIAGNVYSKGLRTHPDKSAPAEFVYDISGYHYTTFSATVGKDSLGGKGNVQFFVLADGVIVGESPVLAFGEDYNLACDITGCQILTLRATNGGDGESYDSCAWGNARISNDAIQDLNGTANVPADDGLEAMDKYASYLADLSKFPLTFDYDGRTYVGLGGEDFTEVSRNTTTEALSETTIINVTHKASGVTITVEAVAYPAYDAFEWTVYFTNHTGADTKTFSNINGANMAFYGENPTIEGLGGDYENRFTKYRKQLNSTWRTGSTTGRPTHDAFPYYNLEYGDGGVFIAVGWPGTYFAEFSPVQIDGKTATSFRAGQSNFSSYLKPGESVRTPLMAFVYYDEQGDAATNTWRKWFMDCNMPKNQAGENMQPLMSASTSWLYNCMTSANEKSQLDAIRQYLEYGIELDAWWMDAGWYFGGNQSTIGHWHATGTWQVDTRRFPTSLKSVCELAASNDMDTILWFEPELFRVPVKDLQKIYPEFKDEWVLGNQNMALGSTLLDMGNPEVVEWIFEAVTKVMDEAGITIYRQDFNEHPGPVWISSDEIGRSGIVENAYCQGYLTYWDMLREKYPDGMIDNCASGGGRLDLESMRRSVALHRTDSVPATDDYAEAQAITAALAEWLVYFGGPANGNPGDEIYVYNMRSIFAPAMTLNFNIQDQDKNWELLQALSEEWNVIKDYYYADYYELLPGNREQTQWRSWEYYDAEKGEGFIQVFRPYQAKGDVATLKLKGLDPDKTYVLTDFDQINSITATGAELMAGYTVTLKSARSAATIFIGSEAIDVPDYSRLIAEAEAGQVPEGSIYVSDLPIQSWIMYGGTSDSKDPPYRPSIDRGENGPLMVGGVLFQKGLRSHVNAQTKTAEFVFDISELDVDYFRATVGKDMEGSAQGRVKFLVFVDDVKVAESPILNMSDSYEIKAEVTGGKILKLQATDGGDGVDYDGVAWGNPVLYKASAEIPDETDPIETDPAETDPVETDPVETDPVETDPTESHPMETDLAGTTEQPADSDKGCGSTLTSSLAWLAIGGVGGAGLLLKRRKENEV